MLFDDLFYPGNPGRRQQVSDLRGQVRADFKQFTTSWNDCATLLNSILSARYPQYTLQLLTCNVDNDCLQMCVDDFNRVVNDAKPKIDKLVRDIGLADGIGGLPVGNLDLDPDALHKLNAFITGAVDTAVATFATWYVYNSIRFFVLVLEWGGVAVNALASFLGGALGGMIAGAIGFVITDLIGSAIAGAVERKQLNEAIDALTTLRDQVADPLLRAAGRLAGVAQSIRDGSYRLSDTLLIVKVGDSYQVITLAPTPATVRVALVRQDFSDCLNSDVRRPAAQSAPGVVSVTRGDGRYAVSATFNLGTANTTYQFFLKCHYQLGTVTTDGTGFGQQSFSFPASDVGNAFAFDAYPAGAPAGNKFQSEQVRVPA